MRACLQQVDPELYDRTIAPLNQEIRMLKTEVIETLLHGCVTWSLKEKTNCVPSNGCPPSCLAGHRLPAFLCTDHATRALPEHQTTHKRRPFCWRRGTAKQEAITRSCDVRDDGRRRKPKTWRSVQDTASMRSRNPRLHRRAMFGRVARG